MVFYHSPHELHAQLAAVKGMCPDMQILSASVPVKNLNPDSRRTSRTGDRPTDCEQQFFAIIGSVSDLFHLCDLRQGQAGGIQLEERTPPCCGFLRPTPALRCESHLGWWPPCCSSWGRNRSRGGDFLGTPSSLEVGELCGEIGFSKGKKVLPAEAATRCTVLPQVATNFSRALLHLPLTKLCSTVPWPP